MPADEVVFNCSTCIFFVPSGSPHVGSCHRFPPVTWITECAAEWAWPEVEPDEWCGEHKANVSHGVR